MGGRESALGLGVLRLLKTFLVNHVGVRVIFTLVISLVPLVGIEPTLCYLQNSCLTTWLQRRMLLLVEQAAGIAPASLAWKARAHLFIPHLLLPYLLLGIRRRSLRLGR